MRKVKLLAFVLAALMVVAAFAGCGTKEIEANVTDLDERVSKLEELLNKVNDSVEKGATADQIDELLEAIAANKAAADKADSDLTDKLGQIAKDNAAALEALKKDNAAALDALKKSLEGKDSDLSKALESLTKSLEETNKAIAANKTSTDTAIANAITELNKAIEALKTSQDTTDAEQDKKINDLIASLDKTLGELNTKLDELGKTDSLDALKESYIDRLESKEADLAVNSIDYTAEEINKLTTIIAAGKTDIRAAATEEKVAEAYDAVAKEIDKYVPVAKQLANAIDAKLGTIKHDTNLTSLQEIYNKAVAHYDGGETSKSLTEYGANKRNLVDEYTAIGAAKTDAATIKTKAETIVSAVNGVKEAGGVILGTNNSIVATQYNDYLKFIAQVDANKWLNKSALKALVTNADLLLQYQARISVLVQAQTAYEVLGGYDNTFVSTVSVFKAYDDLGADKTLYTAKSVYDATTEKLNSWMTAYGLNYADKAGKANIKYIIGSATKYDEYLANQKKVNALNEKYATFTADIVTRVLAFEKLTVINDTNIAERAAINEAVKTWKKVWAASEGVAEFNVDDANYAKMIENGFADTRTELFIYNDTVRTFYTTTYAAAEAYAAKINTVIDKLAKDFKDGKNFNTVLVFKELYGYEYKADKSGYVLAAKVETELTTDPTIKSFIDIYKKDQYDLTSLLHMTAYNDTLKAVEDRIAAYQATAKSITDKYDAIVKKMTDTDHITDVNLTYETAVNEVYAIYAGMTGFNAEMASWGLKKDKTDVWEFTDLMKKTTYEGVYELKNDIDVLRSAADKLVEYYGILTKAFNKTQVAADDDVTEVYAKYDQFTEGSGTSAKTYDKYISKVEKNSDGVYVYTYSNTKDAAMSEANCLSIAKAAELGDTLYNWFVAQNGGKKYDAVETARNAAFDSQKLLVVKSYAISAVLEAVKGANYDKTYGFNVCQDTAVAKILAVKSIKAVAEEVHHFVVEAGADYSNTNNTGAYIAAITFGADKDGNAVTVIGVNGDGVALRATLQ